MGQLPRFDNKLDYTSENGARTGEYAFSLSYSRRSCKDATFLKVREIPNSIQI